MPIAVPGSRVIGDRRIGCETPTRVIPPAKLRSRIVLILATRLPRTLSLWRRVLAICKCISPLKSVCVASGTFMINSSVLLAFLGAGVAQSVQCLATDWTTGRSRFDPRQGRKDFSSNLCVQTGSGAHPASCTMGIGGPFPGGKTRPGHDADRSPHLMPRSWLSRSYTSSPPCSSIGIQTA
jgi:hypothetical protein